MEEEWEGVLGEVPSDHLLEVQEQLTTGISHILAVTIECKCLVQLKKCREDGNVSLDRHMTEKFLVLR